MFVCDSSYNYGDDAIFEFATDKCSVYMICVQLIDTAQKVNCNITSNKIVASFQ
jgi:hypothetical protein